MGLKVRFFYGVDGSLLNVESFDVHESIVPDKEGWRLRNGVIGAGLSHSLLWNVILRLGYDQALILEDDVEFVDNFTDRFEAEYASLPFNWDIFFLGAGDTPEGPTGMYAYMIRQKALELCIRQASTSLIDIDVLLRDSILKRLNYQISYPPMVTEKSVNNGELPQKGIWKSLTYDWK